MKEKIRIYYYFIIGAAGGLTGWLLGTLFLRLLGGTEAEATPAGWQRAFYGAVLGSVIGISVAAYDGIVSRSMKRFVKFGGIGLLLGAAAGALALLLAQASYEKLLGGIAASGLKSVLIGTLCWVLFGGLIGFGEGISKGTQSWKGFLGGTIGGLVGGMIYEINRAAAVNEDVDGDRFRQLLLALSLALLGAAVSAAIALVTSALKQAWFEILDGKFASRNFDVTKYVDPKLGRHRSGMIGSDQWSSNVYLPGDDQVLPHHADIAYSNGAPTLIARPEAVKRASTLVNGRRVSSCPLSDGDKLQIGSTNMIFRQKRK